MKNILAATTFALGLLLSGCSNSGVTPASNGPTALQITDTTVGTGATAAAGHTVRVKAGLPFLRIHDLRHQYASFLVNAGRTLYEVQQILGHSDPSVTQRYAHLSTKSLQDAANSASIMIPGAMPVAIPMNLPLLVDLSEPVEMAMAA